MSVLELSKLGGIFALLVFWHFVADWLFQSHDEAMQKSNNAKIRARHCMVYSVGFVPLLIMLQLTLFELFLALITLFVSHFFEDTYYPVFLWVKYVRRPPEFSLTSVHSDKEAFLLWFATPLGKIIGIVVDQLVHIAFLLPIAYFAV
jgi:hypothetical protein